MVVRASRTALAGALLAVSIPFVVSGCVAGGDADPSPPAQRLSLSPVSNQVYECLVGRGWEPKLTWDGGIEVSSETMTKEQLPLYDEDEAECWEPVNASIDGMTDSEILGVYEAELATRDCLIAEGFAVDTPPSAQTYLDSFPDETWMAYSASDVSAVMADDAKWRGVNEACPQPSWSLGAQ